MKPYIMSITFSGIKNIIDPIEIVFHDKIRSKLFSTKQSNVKVITGANGAGKSAVIHAIDLYYNLMEESNYLVTHEDHIRNLMNIKCHRFTFAIHYAIYSPELQHVQSQYEHHLVIEENNQGKLYVKSEKLTLYSPSKSKRSNVIFSFEDGEYIEGILNQKTIDRMKNIHGPRVFWDVMKNSILASLPIDKLSTIEKLPSSLSYINDDVQATSSIPFICQHMWIVTDSEDDHDYYIAQKKLTESRENTYQGNVKEQSNKIPLLSTYSFIINKQSLESFNKDHQLLIKFIQLFKYDLKTIECEYKETGDNIIIERYFVYDYGRIHIEYESAGIKKLAQLFFALQFVSQGNILIIDELDAQLGDIYLNRLIEYISLYTTGQLLFTSHNLTPLNFLKDKKHSIDFLTNQGTISSWVRNGNYTPFNVYRNGLISEIPFNIESFDFCRIFEVDVGL